MASLMQRTSFEDSDDATNNSGKYIQRLTCSPNYLAKLKSNDKKHLTNTKEQYETIEKMIPVQQIFQEIDIILLYTLLDLTYYTEEFLHILFEITEASANIKTYDIESYGSIERYIDEQKSFGGPEYHWSS
ncbi:unnamed protein product [Adineta steineri]|uniref:Uncharacterized protein n=1 Tax=Adineta steineri TaxID=433720 RepID=A0A814HAN1_9BILA|nr:unnamed protein product [Adineta steineri]CAF1006598.1 unnamed protein product [Adineta steineri]